MSTRTTARKLLIKPNTTIWSSSDSHLSMIQPLPENVRVVDRLEDATTAIVFIEGSASLRAMLDEHRDQLSHPGNFWVAYPKGNRIDINRNSLWPILGEYGMRPIGQVSVDDVWSVMRFRSLGEGEAPFMGGRQRG
jgi:hypothetical protein